MKFESDWLLLRKLRVASVSTVPSKVQRITSHPLVLIVIHTLLLISCQVHNVEVAFLRQRNVVVAAQQYPFAAVSRGSDQCGVFIAHVYKHEMGPVIFDPELHVIAHIFIVLAKFDVRVLTTTEGDRLLWYSVWVVLTEHLVLLEVTCYLMPHIDYCHFNGSRVGVYVWYNLTAKISF